MKLFGILLLAISQANAVLELDASLKVAVDINADIKHSPMLYGDLAARFGEKASKMIICYDGPCKDAIKTQISSVTEIDAAGAAVTGRASGDLSGMATTWTEPKKQEAGGKTRTGTTGTSTIVLGEATADTNANMETEAYAYHDANTEKNGDQELAVAKGSLKYSFTFTEWTFAATTTNFTVTMQLAVEGSAKATADPKMTKWGKDDSISRFDLGGDKYFDAPTVCWVDEKAANVTVDVKFNADAGYTVYFTFPKFTTKLYYDPVAGNKKEGSTDDAGAGSKSTSSIISYSMTMLLLSMATALGLHL